VLAGVIVGLNRSGQHGPTPGPPSPPGGTSSAGASTASLAGTLTAPDGGLMSDAFFSADGRYVAAAGTGADVYVWDAATRQRVQTLSVGTGDRADPVGFSADDQILYVIDTASKQLYDFDVASGKAPNVYSLPSGVTWGDTWDSAVLAAVASDGSIGVYNMATGKLDAQVQNPGSAQVEAVHPDGDGKYLVVSDENGEAYLVATGSGDVVGTFGYAYSAAEVNFPSISLDGKTVYVPGGSARPAKLWDTVTKSYDTPAGARWPKQDNGITFSTDGKSVITSPSFSSDTVDTWDIATRAHVATVTVPGSADQEVLSVTPGAGEVLTTGSLDSATGTFSKLSIWKMP
jgi:WD40 repeat protein